MRKFTVKDFILYDSPCFSCGKPILFKLCSKTNASNNHILGDEIYHTPIISGSSLEVDVAIRYVGSVKLKIDCKTNKFNVTNAAGLTKYLADHKLFLDSYCNNCYTRVRSIPLKFNLEYGFIYPTEVLLEYVFMNDGNNVYALHSFADINKSELVVRRIDSSRTIAPSTVQLPYIPMRKYRSRRKLLDKLKMYVLFS